MRYTRRRLSKHDAIGYVLELVHCCVY